MKNDMQFTGKNGEFQIRHMVEKTQLNFPVANEEGIKSSVTQTFGGDCKLDQNHFLLEPVSIENLHNNRSTRNVWCTINRKEHVSLTGVSAQAEYAQKFIIHFLKTFNHHPGARITLSRKCRICIGSHRHMRTDCRLNPGICRRNQEDFLCMKFPHSKRFFRYVFHRKYRKACGQLQRIPFFLLIDQCL